MKKFSLLLLAALMIFAVSTITVAQDAALITTFGGSSYTSTIGIPINDDITLRTGLGLSVIDGDRDANGEEDDNSYALKIGACVKPLMALNIDVISNGKIDDLFGDFSVQVSKTYAIQIVENLKLGCLVNLICVQNVGDNNDILLLNGLYPVLVANVSLF
ncbi:hypothetical protein ACFLZV_04945 [Candidatus Margulisiibacteriota bacterium]